MSFEGAFVEHVKIYHDNSDVEGSFQFNILQIQDVNKPHNKMATTKASQVRTYYK